MTDKKTFSSVMEMVEATSEPDFTIEFAKQQIAATDAEIAQLREDNDRLRAELAAANECISEIYEEAVGAQLNSGYADAVNDVRHTCLYRQQRIEFLEQRAEAAERELAEKKTNQRKAVKRE